MSIYVIDIEPIPTRYTIHWQEYLPDQIRSYTNHEVINISGGVVPASTTPGAFLNFSGTNIYKARQIEQISSLINSNSIKSGDYFLFLDAWNPAVIQLRYMVELLGLKVKIGGLWHAGSYDPQDFLGRLIGDQPWVRHAEYSMFSCYDDNFFATQYHIDLFANGIFDWNDGQGWTVNTPQDANDSIKLVGWPMEYSLDLLSGYDTESKEDIIVFPHRISKEKQPDIFKDLAASLPEYKFVIAQELNLSKDEYHELLAKSKLMFSANLQETLGITSGAEGPLLGCVPIVPDRLSYSEMFSGFNDLMYPSEWTISWEQYCANKPKIISKIHDVMINYDHYRNESDRYLNKRFNRFFSGHELYQVISQRPRSIKVNK